jgi:hypothetical protein
MRIALANSLWARYAAGHGRLDIGQKRGPLPDGIIAASPGPFPLVS